MDVCDSSRLPSAGQEQFLILQTRLLETGRKEQNASTNLKQGSQHFKILEVVALYCCECKPFLTRKRIFLLLFDVTGLVLLSLLSEHVWFEVCVLTAFSMLLFSVEMSGHDMVCFDKTFEAAEALLHMESPGGLHNERNTGKHTVSTFSSV